MDDKPKKREISFSLLLARLSKKPIGFRKADACNPACSFKAGFYRICWLNLPIFTLHSPFSTHRNMPATNRLNCWSLIRAPTMPFIVSRTSRRVMGLFFFPPRLVLRVGWAKSTLVA